MSRTPRIAAALAGAAVALTAACTPFPATPEPVKSTLSPTISVTAPATAAPSPTTSPSPTFTAQPTPTPSVTVEGPIVSAPKGDPVTPEVTFAAVDEEEGIVVVQASVPGIVEDGGTCTVTLTVSATVRTQTRTAAGNVTSTECGQYHFSLTDVPAGRGVIIVKYASSAHKGTSVPTEVTIP